MVIGLHGERCPIGHYAAAKQRVCWKMSSRIPVILDGDRWHTLIASGASTYAEHCTRQILLTTHLIVPCFIVMVQLLAVPAAYAYRRVFSQGFNVTFSASTLSI